MENPWKTLSSREIYTNPWIQVREDQVINPNGGEGIYGVISFKNIAIGIIPIDEDNHTWLVGQYRYTLDTYSWEIPMGGGLKDIPIIESAQRELVEETGLVADHWEEILTLHTSNSVTDEVGHVFVAKGLTQTATHFDETEKLAIRKLPLSEAISMAVEGEITDAISIAALMKIALKPSPNPS